MTKMNRIITLRHILPTYLLLVAVWCMAQPPHTFTQYTAQQGLSQKVVQSILQDRKGRMWFATWDGLYCFDGYEFEIYKTHPGDSIHLGNNRIDNLHEDSFGGIWGQSYDQHLFRFDPVTCQFQSIPDDHYAFESFELMPDGTAWGVTNDGKLICITSSLYQTTLKTQDFFLAHKLPYPHSIYKLYTAQHNRLWLLTSNGLYCIQTSSPHTAPAIYLQTKNDSPRPFFDVYRQGNTLYFGSHRGEVWKYDGKNFSLLKLPTSSPVHFVRILKNGQLFAGTEDDGFLMYDMQKRTTLHPALNDKHIKQVHVDSHGLVWIRNGLPGVWVFHPQDGRTDHFILQDKYGKDIKDSRPEMFICEDAHGSLWLHPSGGGLAWYDRNANRIHPFYNPALQSGWNADNKITGMYTDRQGNLWFCSYGNGLEKATFHTSPFMLLTSRPDDPDFPGNNTRAVFQDRDGNFWIGGKDKIVRVYDRNHHYIGNLTHQGHISPNSTDEVGNAYCITQDHTGTVWIGTKGNGLIAADPEGSPYRYRLMLYTPQKDNAYSLSGRNIYCLHEDSNQRLWIATFDGGLNYIDLKAGHYSPQFIHARNELKGFPLSACFRTRFVTSDRKGDIWIGTTNGLLRCHGSFAHPSQAVFQRFERNASDTKSLSNNDVHCIVFTQKGEMYVSTFGGGLNKLLCLRNGKAEFRAYTTSDGLASDIILSICEDKKGKLWLASETELSLFNPTDGHIENYPAKMFPQRLNFNEGSSLYSPSDNKIWFNTTKGALGFSPSSVSLNQYIPSILLTDFQLDGQTIRPCPDGILTTHIDDTHTICLPHGYHSFSLRFAALDMADPQSISYAYRLDGIDTAWHYTNNHTATYTKLPAGKYLLRIKSTNSNGSWIENTRSLQLTIMPPFWKSTMAYMFYVLIPLLAGTVVFYLLHRQAKRRRNDTIEEPVRQEPIDETESVPQGPLPTPTLSSADQEFLDKLYDLLERNMDNSNLQVKDLAGEMHMSRSIFFNRLKSLTGLSPVELLRKKRMERAAQLIETELYSMTQVADMTGFNDSHYFSKCFKQQYGITPTEYKEKRKAATSSQARNEPS